MFNKDTADSKTNTGKSPVLNMISEGTRIVGDVHSDNDIRVSGQVEGEANSKGRVIVTSTGNISGNIRAGDADIAGKVEGELFITGKLILRKSAVINGDIHTKSLLVEEGAQINGNCNMGVDSALGKNNKAAENDKKSFKEIA